MSIGMCDGERLDVVVMAVSSRFVLNKRVI
nr:MAG TPA: hypothetical protein [Caudoviricetes sp.]